MTDASITVDVLAHGSDQQDPVYLPINAVDGIVGNSSRFHSNDVNAPGLVAVVLPESVFVSRVKLFLHPTDKDDLIGRIEVRVGMDEVTDQFSGHITGLIWHDFCMNKLMVFSLP